MFHNFCYRLNVARLSLLAALFRALLHMLLATKTKEGRYDHPDRIGYQAWIEAPLVGVLAFRKLDGTLLWRW